VNGNYELRLYDETLLTFALSHDAAVGYSVKIDKVGEPHTLFPLDMELTGEGVLKWLNRRTIPKHRAYVHNILNTMGLSFRDTKGIIDICRGLSLNDSYWVVPEGFDGSFADYNLFENRFSEILALTALTGESLSEKKARQVRTSPEFTTSGMLPKAWRYTGGRIILLFINSRIAQARLTHSSVRKLLQAAVRFAGKGVRRGFADRAALPPFKFQIQAAQPIQLGF